MDVGLILKAQIEKLLANGEFEAALVACFSALKIAPLDDCYLISCAEIFRALGYPQEAKTLYFICLGFSADNENALKQLRQLWEENPILILSSPPKQYVGRIVRLVTETASAKMGELATHWQISCKNNLINRCFWIAACMMKFCFPRMPPEEQKDWLETFQGFLDNRGKINWDVKRNVVKTTLEEKYFCSSLRFALANFFLEYSQESGNSELPFIDLVSYLLILDVWKLGCLDRWDQMILEKILIQFESFSPGIYPEYQQFLVCVALMFFRHHYRVSNAMDSDAIFQSYLDVLREMFPQQKNNVYISRVLSSYNLPQEKALWFIENFPELVKFKDKHVGESCYILGNGPSLNRMDLSPLRDKITFGLNKIFLLFDKLGFNTTYLVAANAYVLQQSASELKGLDMPKFILMWGREFVKKQRNTIFLREKVSGSFSKNLVDGVVVDSTVTHMALQLVYYMGFKTVVLIGVDHNFTSQGVPHATVTLSGEDPNHFDPNYFGFGIPWQLPDLKGSERAYINSKKIFEDDNRIILDATVGGNLHVFQKIRYEDSLEIV